ncbi:MAG: hypothetical protein ACSHXY_09205 [Alphaproteobacteria bacterium]
MIIHLKAFAGTLLLMLLMGAFIEVLIYSILIPFHPSHSIEIFGEGLGLLGILIASIFVYRLTLQTERGLLNEK